MSKKPAIDFEAIFNDWLYVDGVKYYGPKYVKNIQQTAKNRLKEIERLRLSMEQIYAIAKVSKSI